MLLLMAFAGYGSIALAGNFNSSDYSQTTVSHGRSETSGESVSTQNGTGISAMGELFNGRVETYERNDSTITEFEGDSRTNKITVTNGSSTGLTGSSISMTDGVTRGHMDYDTSVDDSIAGTYEQFTYDANGFNYESGTFSEGTESNTSGHETYRTEFEAESMSAYATY